MSERPLSRRLAAIVVADVVGYTGLMERDEARTHAALRSLRAEIVDPTTLKFGGRIVKGTGDGWLAEFPSVTDAVASSLEIQALLAQRNAVNREAGRLELRVGVNLGEIIIDGDDIYGTGINVAARLQAMAAPGGVTVSDAVRSALRGHPDFEWHDLGEHRVRNLEAPIRVFELRISDAAADRTAATPAASPRLAAWDKPSIAVLPFVDLSRDDRSGYLVDGMTEDIITELSRYGDLAVIARNSVFSLRESQGSAMQAARDLNARFVVEGSVRRMGDRVRITAKLFDTVTGQQLWAERFDRGVDELVATQDEITQQIVASIAPQIHYAARDGAHYEGAAGSPSIEPALRASALIWRGWDNADVEMISQGIAMAEAALTIDPRRQRALAMLALGCQARAEFRPSNEQADLDAASAAAAALQAIDATNHVAWLVLGIVALRRHEHDKALACLRRSHALNPNDVLALRFLAWEESNWGLGAEALDHAKRALLLSPRDPALEWIYWVMGLAAYVAGDLDAAVEHGRQAMFLNPRNTQHWGVLAASYAERGDLAEAHRLIEIARQERPDYVESRLRGKSYFARPELGARYTAALRKAADGPALHAGEA